MPCATARVRLVGDNLKRLTAKIERMATLKALRGKGIEPQLMRFILKDIQKNKHVVTITLSAQEHAMPFYAKLGFTAIGDAYLDADISHRDMVLDVI